MESGTIHGLLGENGAGKTTLMKILSGFQSADSGQIRLDDVPLSLSSPAEALSKGIGMLYQDPLDFGPFVVLDNLIMGRGNGFLLPRREARREFLALAQRFDFAIDPDAQVQSLTVGERQQLEILRLLSQGIQILILDEPTTGISASQKVKLFATLRRLAHEEGKSVLFVSHKLEEVQELCDRVTVLCQGRVSGRVKPPCNTDELVSLMFGKSILASRRERIRPGRPVLELEDVSIHAYHMQVPNLSLQVHEGEVIGIAGLEGSGQRVDAPDVCRIGPPERGPHPHRRPGAGRPPPGAGRQSLPPVSARRSGLYSCRPHGRGAGQRSGADRATWCWPIRKRRCSSIGTQHANERQRASANTASKAGPTARSNPCREETNSGPCRRCCALPFACC